MLPEAIRENAEQDRAPGQKGDKSVLAGVLIVLAGLALFFYRAVFLGKPIAKLGLLPEIDSMFNPALKKAIISFTDPSGYLIFFPTGFFAESMWSRFVPPIWNPAVACGYPLAGDPQAMIHSLAHFLALYSSPAAYNAGLLLEIAVGGIGMYLLGRYMNMSVPASIFVAFAYELSPRVLVQVDISGQESFFPWVFLSFACLARKPSLLRAALTGVVCALMAFSAHPETIFFAVLFAALLAYFSMVFQRIGGAGSCVTLSGSTFMQVCINAAKAKLQAIGYLLISAAVAIIVALPLILPFLEFMRNSHLYKESYGGASTSSWSEFLNGFFAGQGLEPLFIGSVAAMLVLPGLLRKTVSSISLALSLVIAFILAMPQGPILQLLSQKPFNFVATYYITPEIILILALLSGIGFDLVCRERPARPHLFMALFSCGMVLLAPFLLIYAQSGSGVSIWEFPWLKQKVLSYTSFIVAAAWLFVAAAMQVNRLENPPPAAKFLPAVCAAVLIAMNFGSLALAGRKILPVNPAFALVPPPPVAFLQKVKARCAAVGKNFFLPNTNLDFGVQDFRCFSPLLTTRYHNFLKACGAETYNLYFYSLPERCSKLLDLASVKYIASGTALAAEDELPQSNLPNSFRGRLLPGLRIIDSKLSYEPLNSQLNAELHWRIHDHNKNRYSAIYSVLGSDGKELWSSRGSVLAEAINPEHSLREYRSFPIPTTAKGQITLSLSITDTWTGTKVKIEDAQFAAADGSIKLCVLSVANKQDLVKNDLTAKPNNTEHVSSSKKSSSEASPSKTEHDRSPNKAEVSADKKETVASNAGVPAARRLLNIPHFKLAQEYLDAGCRIYENKKACPAAYLVKKVTHVSQNKDPAEFFARMQSANFSPQHEALIEDGLSLNESIPPTPIKAAQLSRPDCNTVLINCDADGQSYLILTDTYYPGWKCYVDGAEATIYPANYLFRAVKVSGGHHEVKFVFAPANYYYSWAASLLLMLGLFARALQKRAELLSDRETV